ncbi:VOC family protein [Austwickia chelonae]|uniref:VOC family protein n=1 Tax=Austwickia chelonae TaxID=100225 RepID=UPI000E283247|nr:VOC family protein [Austwickia chelonae]
MTTSGAPTVTLDHAGLYVADLERSRDFFRTYFGATSNDGYHNPRTGLRTYFLSFDGRARLEIMTRPGVDRTADEGLLGWAHIAFRLGSRVAVDETTSRLLADGYEVVDGPRLTGDGYYEAVVLDHEGNRIELVA